MAFNNFGFVAVRRV